MVAWSDKELYFIERDLQSIGDRGCTFLVHVSFHGFNSVESIDNQMFSACTSLVRVYIIRTVLKVSVIVCSRIVNL
jgi:hypothetical protein